MFTCGYHSRDKIKLKANSLKDDCTQLFHLLKATDMEVII
jgi:hypothetical protein